MIRSAEGPVAHGPVRAAVAIAILLAFAGCASAPRAPIAPLRPISSSPVARPMTRRASCDEPAWAAEPARANAASIDTLPWAGFGRAETGWSIYAPAMAVEIATPCPATSAGFAGDMLRWQSAQGLAATGAVEVGTLDQMRRLWQARRPFVSLRARRICPDPPPDAELDAVAPQEGLSGKPVRLRRRALAAYRALVAAARPESPAIAADPALLTLFSGYRDAAFDAERCTREGNCQGVARARCSAHRTGLAIDIHVGGAPGYPVDSSADANRRAQVQGVAYRWLIVNARRFGFAPYAFEPWHWEWTGEAP